MSSVQQTPALFQPIKVGRLTLQQRVVLCPLTRFRAHASHVPGPQAASYYSQRASTPGSLVITEGTFISHDAGGYPNVPGIYTDEQIEVWKKVTDAVHAKGSYIFLQLWSLGRCANPSVFESQIPPSSYVSASDVALSDRLVAPRPLREDEIESYIATYAKAASDAVDRAGFDGVEVHNANGYLLDQFLQTNSNKRTDKWGGNEEGRTKFSREVIDAIANAIGEDRVGIRLSPWSDYLDMKMEDPKPTFTYLVAALRDKHPRMAYLHVTEPRVAGAGDRDSTHDESNDFLREIWNGGQGGQERTFISAGGYTRESALHIAEEKGGMIGFGRLFISNPDLPVRLEKNLPLTPSDRSKYYLVGDLTPLGYNDWPFADGHAEGVDGKL